LKKNSSNLEENFKIETKNLQSLLERVDCLKAISYEMENLEQYLTENFRFFKFDSDQDNNIKINQYYQRK